MVRGDPGGDEVRPDEGRVGLPLDVAPYVSRDDSRRLAPGLVGSQSFLKVRDLHRPPPCTGAVNLESSTSRARPDRRRRRDDLVE